MADTPRTSKTTRLNGKRRQQSNAKKVKREKRNWEAKAEVTPEETKQIST
jgi:hypothetical protein